MNNTEKIQHTDDLEQCSQLWHKLTEIQGSKGVTDSFNFRVFYSSLFNSKPFFIYDSLQNPIFIAPLCWDGHVYDWFGTKEIDFPPLLVDFSNPSTFLSVLQYYKIDSVMENVGQNLFLNLKKNSLIETYSKTGTKVVVDQDHNIAGHSHWSQRNLHRSKKAIEDLSGEWKLFDTPSEDQVFSILDDSIMMFSVRNKISKFTLDAKRKKYVDLFTSNIPGVLSTAGSLLIKDEVAISFLAHVYKKRATVSVITLNASHIHRKSITQHGFKFAIVTLPKLLNEHFGTEEVDYQGGNHLWKQEVSTSCQFPQYIIKLKNDKF